MTPTLAAPGPIGPPSSRFVSLHFDLKPLGAHLVWNVRDSQPRLELHRVRRQTRYGAGSWDLHQADEVLPPFLHKKRWHSVLN